MKLFVGLGNPGEQYAQNRHNIGFMAVDEIARHHNFSSWRKRFHGVTAEGRFGAHKCLLLKPSTYMNDSGRAVQDAARFYKIELDDIVVFHDELDLKPGKLKVKTGGGNAGHNGLRSISAHVGNDYIRARLGIGHPGQKDIVHIYVLRDFTKTERAWLDPFIDAIAKSAPHLANSDAPKFMNQVALLLQPEAGAKKETQKTDAKSHSAKNQNTVSTQSETPQRLQAKGKLAEQLNKWWQEQN